MLHHSQATSLDDIYLEDIPHIIHPDTAARDLADTALPNRIIQEWNLPQGYSRFVSRYISCHWQHPWMAYRDTLDDIKYGKLVLLRKDITIHAVLHIADCALERLPSETENIAVIATEAALDAGFYQQRLHLMGKRCVSSDPLRAITTRLIALIKQNGFTCPEVITQWRNLISMAQEAGAQGVIIACTDISPLLESHPQQHLSIVDTASSLTEAAIRSFAKTRSAQ